MSYRHLLVVALALYFSPSLWAQELEPRAYLVTPVGTNAVTIIYQYSAGAVLFDPTLPIEGARGNINIPSLSYYRSLGFLGRSANITFTVPYTFGTIKGRLLGESEEVYRSGRSSPGIRLAWNLYGGPAMNRKEFAGFSQGTTLALSLKVITPWGQYNPDHAINIGTNRWSFKPELGFIQPLGKGRKWFAEVDAGMWVFTTNNDYFRGTIRQQNPILSMQFHLVRVLHRRAWVAFDANGYLGGRTNVGGTEMNDFQENSRVGGSLGYFFNRHQSLKMSVSAGAYTTIGGDFKTASVGYQYSW